MIATHAPAQPPLPLHLESINIDQGLSQGYVTGIIQDKKGFMWFTTGDGLNKYDGYTFTVYHHDINDTTSIGSDDLTSIFEDSQERLWIGTRHNGFDLFDRERGIFTHIRHTDANSLQSDDVIGITEDKEGGIWIRTSQGIDRLAIIAGKTGPQDAYSRNLNPSQTFVFTHIPLDSAYESEKDKYATRGIFVDSRNRVLLTTDNKIWEVKFSGNLRSYSLIKRYTFSSKYLSSIGMLLEDTLNHNLYLKTQEVIRFPNGDFNSAKTIYSGANIRSP